MQEKYLRIKLSDGLLKRYKLVCIKNDLSFPKQTRAIIENFVELQEQKEKNLKN